MIFSEEKRNAIEAKEYVQRLAFAPIAFQASMALRKTGILECVGENNQKGIGLEEIAFRLKLPVYGARVLLEAGLGIGLFTWNEEGLFHLGKAGFFLLYDPLTQVNFDFVSDICYLGMQDLEMSVKEGAPTGLKTLGNWNTVYEGLSSLPDRTRNSWLAFDHYYSDASFPQALEIVLKEHPRRLLDIGGNTGKWALQCVKKDPSLHVTIVDLPGQITMAEESIRKTGFGNRVSFHPGNILDESSLFPKGSDAIWMSQFLDCFSEDQITSILRRCGKAISEKGFIYILEPFWDLQRFEVASYCLQMTSLYFTNIANGYSQMYTSKLFLACILRAELEVVEQFDEIGVGYTLLKCRNSINSPNASVKA